MMEHFAAAVSGGKYIDVSGGRKLHVTDIGNGRPILLIPGLPMSNEIFGPTSVFLADAGFRAISITLSGFGLSDPAEHYPVEMHAADIDQVISILDLENVVLAGYSYGGVIAAYYAAVYSSTRLTHLMLISANVPKYSSSEDFPFGMEKDAIDQLNGFIRSDMPANLDLYGPVFALTEAEMPKATAEWLTAINLQTTPEGISEGLSLLRDTDLRQQFGNIRVPVTIMHGRTDTMVPFEIAEQAFALLSNAEMITFEEGGHWFIFTGQEVFHQALLKTLLECVPHA
ncbi:alpha/beta hydrolase [Mucilaginibacter conchicola]|uniref:Alpha/beta hydrolase n=1 Tax=Mucilaginibacter conchicola TaxID=2303333 RepID=A0A372NPS8_9SPHI|nr:alpha/beta hydrolase [Mucilaginibacter conchicola]RFZ90263.1 alpha/beta hydrolase [Mucilaginibacter conchicola]